ncbi:MAG: GTP-binding protein [Desulfobacterales bacterium]|nr:GTP-binding protein [Deltaproteobacteria bacterium]NNL77666.1 GTP-binding protein [Desulfobacterales bacterium]
MPDETRVYLITGFLGSGKTTLLNRIIDRFPKDQKLTLLVNEFGEIGVDGTLVEGEDIDMMEISKGSIFCVCVKTDFIKGLYELNSKVKPDVLLIESTGVANPSDLKKDLKLPIFNDRFHFSEQFCLIDAVHFLDAYGVYASLEKQIASSTVFIINKIDIASSETIEKTKKVIQEFHPNPLFYDTTYADIPLDNYFKLEAADVLNPGLPESNSDEKALLSDEELEQFIDDLLDSPDLEITPPDSLMSVAYQWNGDQLKQIEKMADALPASVVRAKGFVEEKNTMYLFNYVMGTWTIEKTDLPDGRIKHRNIVVFIGPPESMKGIGNASKTGNWSSQGTFQPYSQS